MSMGLTLMETTEFEPEGTGTKISVRVAMPAGGTLMGRLMRGMVARKLKTLFAENYKGHIQRMATMAKAQKDLLAAAWFEPRQITQLP